MTSETRTLSSGNCQAAIATNHKEHRSAEPEPEVPRVTAKGTEDTKDTEIE